MTNVFGFTKFNRKINMILLFRFVVVLPLFSESNLKTEKTNQNKIKTVLSPVDVDLLLIYEDAGSKHVCAHVCHLCVWQEDAIVRFIQFINSFQCEMSPFPMRSYRTSKCPSGMDHCQMYKHALSLLYLYASQCA